MNAGEIAVRILRARRDLLAAVDRLGAEGERPRERGGWTVREVLAHSADWVRLTIGMIDRDHPEALLEFTGTEDFNRKAARGVADESTAQVRDRFAQVSEDIVPLISPLSDEQLHRIGRFEWAPELTLAKAIEENTYAH
jgi:hypothetical protein